MQRIRNSIHVVLRKAGWDVRRTSTIERIKKQQRTSLQLEKWMFARQYCPKTVLDIGANTGQFAELIRQVIPEARIISFEPIEQCFVQLRDNQKIAHPFHPMQIALGNESGERTIHRNEFTPSSSFLPINELHVEEMPSTANVRDELIKIERLDSLADSLALEKPYIVKVDVQGYEEQVILGGRETISCADAVVLEVSAYPLYDGAPSFRRLLELMEELGFAYCGNVDQWKSKKDGRILQFDALFENRSPCTPPTRK